MFFCLVLDIIHKFTRDKYSKRFPELESLVPDSLDYIRTVKVRQDEMLTDVSYRWMWCSSKNELHSSSFI